MIGNKDESVFLVWQVLSVIGTGRVSSLIESQYESFLIFGHVLLMTGNNYGSFAVMERLLLTNSSEDEAISVGSR